MDTVKTLNDPNTSNTNTNNKKIQEIQEILNNDNYILINSDINSPRVVYGDKYNIMNPSCFLVCFAGILSEFIINTNLKTPKDRKDCIDTILSTVAKGIYESIELNDSIVNGTPQQNNSKNNNSKPKSFSTKTKKKK